MPISFSVFILGPVQVDGRRYVLETHTEDTGNVTKVEYLAGAGTNYQAVMDARVLVLTEPLQDLEARELSGGV